MTRDLEIWVFGDHRNHPHDRLTLQVLAHARALAGDVGRVTAIVLGHDVNSIAREYIAHGARRVLLLDDPQLAAYRADLFSTLVGDLVREHRPDIFLLGASDAGKEIAARVSKRIGVGLCADAVSLKRDEGTGKVIATCAAFGGNFLARIAWSEHRPYVATVSAGSAAELPYRPGMEGELVRLNKDVNAVPCRISVISSVREVQTGRKLENAKIVVVGGRGVKTPEGFDAVRELALLLGGEVGATRAAVDAHWTSHDQLIGQTGKSIRPDLLITCGTSGAVQYTAAIRQAGTIVAVNRDARAPIFKMADIGVVADTQSFLPAFIQEVKGHLFREITELYRTQSDPGNKKSSSFGQRIRKLRDDHKMTVLDLAEKTAQPPEFIEQIESDLVAPPVSFLLALSRALDIDPSHFLTEHEKTQINGKRQEGFLKRTQNYSYRTLTPGAEDKHLRAFMVTIEAKKSHKMVEYKHPGEEFIFVYQGELELTLGGKVLQLKQGETMHFDSETKHKLRNISNEPCELIVTLYTP